MAQSLTSPQAGWGGGAYRGGGGGRGGRGEFWGAHYFVPCDCVGIVSVVLFDGHPPVSGPLSLSLSRTRKRGRSIPQEFKL